MTAATAPVVTQSGALHIEGLSTGYRAREVFHSFSLMPIPAGTVTALVGPNGAGKSTLLRAIAGLLPAKGSVKLGKHELAERTIVERAQLVSFMPQALPQRVALTVMETVITAINASAMHEIAGVGGRVEPRAMQVLERMGIQGLALERMDRLSAGQRQMAGLAQAVAREPALLLLDEPTSALDLRYQFVVMKLIRQVAAEGRTVVAVLHDLNLAARWSDHVVVLHGGRVAAEGTPQQAITAETLAKVWGVVARVEQSSTGHLQVSVDDA